MLKQQINPKEFVENIYNFFSLEKDIEVIESSGALEDLEKYLRLSVTEVWFWQKDRLEVYVNRGDRYIKQTASYCLPNLNLELLASLIKQVNTGNLRLLKKQFISQL